MILQRSPRAKPRFWVQKLFHSGETLSEYHGFIQELQSGDREYLSYKTRKTFTASAKSSSCKQNDAILLLMNAKVKNLKWLQMCPHSTIECWLLSSQILQLIA